jgi:hypothetical protein
MEAMLLLMMGPRSPTKGEFRGGPAAGLHLLPPSLMGRMGEGPLVGWTVISRTTMDDPGF